MSEQRSIGERSIGERSLRERSMRVDSRQKRRRLVDRLTALVVGMGGVAVIVAIGLIFMYLLWVVAPLFKPATMAAATAYETPHAASASEAAATSSDVVLLGLQDEGEWGYELTRQGVLMFFDPVTGKPGVQIDVTGGTAVRAATHMEGSKIIVLLADGRVQMIEPQFTVSFTGDRRDVAVSVSFPIGEEPNRIEGVEAGAEDIDARIHDGSLIIVVRAGRQLQLLQWEVLDEGYPLDVPQASSAIASSTGIKAFWLGARGETLFVTGQDAVVNLYDLNDLSEPNLQSRTPLLEDGVALNTVAPLLGGYSLLVADSRGRVAQWTALRQAQSLQLVQIRSFTFPAPVVRLLTESGRKGFLALTNTGELHIAHTTAGRLLASAALGRVDVTAMAIDRQGDAALLQTQAGTVRVAIDNPHPEVSWHSLWEQVWYEGYQEPILAWQSSAADDDFEPKFSLTPLAFGTLKGAFYALLFALPMAILGAIYTAYFMAPSMRAWVKPGIEIMAALPTVVLGFLAGLWLAPLVEGNLMAVFSLFVILPLGFLLIGFLWHLLPDRLTRSSGNGWNAALLVLPIAVLVVVAFTVAPHIELMLFAGDIKSWLKANLDVDYDQRNCLVVGVAMGLAVIPTIFSISEDAIYSVPRQLVQGSLALGATPWQTLTRVVLLTASPGIFSAAMIGMGRAVGETMIVLMATGNTPVMDFSMFQGMRTFAANIAVELPESAVNSTHFRVLFLAALVLFALTFLVNTVAELVRQRLRAKYGNL